MILCAISGGRSGTTNNAPSRPTPAAGRAFNSKRVLPCTVRIIKTDVRTTGSNSRAIFTLLLLVVTDVTVCELEKVVRNELASLAVKRTSTSPKHRLRNTRAAFTRKNINRITGASTMIASRVSGLIVLYLCFLRREAHG